ncbi:MAG TPA: PHP domain-containing protein [Ignavibacteriales bacterium]|nr:PHP domain-containing protein [Ignavibacteriales bacterium]
MLSLHNHSYYSVLEGTIALDELILHAKASGSPYMALADRNNMYGLIQFAKKALSENIKPILGALVDDPKEPALNAVFIARNNLGYSQLCKLITARNLKEDFSLEDVFRKSDLRNLFIISSSLKLLGKIKDCSLWRENIFAELIITEKHKKKTRALYDFARANHLQIVASHPAYFSKAEDYILHRTVTAIRLNSTIHNLPSESLLDEEFCLKSSEEMKELWRALPEAIWNMEQIVRGCSVELDLGTQKFPVFPLPEGETAFSYLWKAAFRGLEEKYKPITEKAIKRLQHELEVIEELNYTDYFLIIWDIIREARRRGMVSIGRGSAANSLVSYCLDFTQVDPLYHNFYFERFLNRGRKSPPDVDLDFSWQERDQIVKYIYDKYGFSNVAMISTVVTFRARSAFREVARAFGIPNEEISRYSKFIPWTGAQNLVDIASKFPEAKSLDFHMEPWRSVIRIASRLAGFPRHLSVHPSGIVITARPITDYVALEYAKNKGLGLIITQPDMYSIEEMGLVKIDLLSQRSLGVLKDTLLRINHRTDAGQQKGPRLFQINTQN